MINSLDGLGKSGARKVADKPVMVFIHGWGLHSGVLGRPLLDQTESRYQMHLHLICPDMAACAC
ncbi:MAG: hypothetical protein ACFHHU_13445 [Porticoccaceae bacterium]